MKRYLEIFLTYLITGVGVVIALACVTMVNSLFFGNVRSFGWGGFEVSVNNGLIVSVFAFGFSIALIFVSSAIVLEDGEHDA